MVTQTAAQMQAAHVKAFHVHTGRQRQANYTARSFERPQEAEKSVVLDSQAQRVFRMRKGILTSSRLINARLAEDKRVRWVPVMVTLTYAPSVEWQPDHIGGFLNAVRKWGARSGYKLPYAWVMELQKNGKPHYHCVIWIPRRLRLPRADSRGWWVHGSTNTVRANNPYGYLAKYASKANGLNGHDFPRGARIHGIGGITEKEAAIIAWWKLPKALRLGDEGSHKWRRQPGGGWRCIEGDACGQFHDTGYGLVAINADKKCVRIMEKPKNLPENEKTDFIGAWQEAVYDAGRVQAIRLLDSLKTYRESWIWGGGGPGFAHPTDAPSLEVSFPIDRQDSFLRGPLPF